MEQVTDNLSDQLPLVSIICTVYNQAAMLENALQSVFDQTYPTIELLVIDNGSNDNSPQVIEQVLRNCPSHIRSSVFIHPFSLNYCESFNQVFVHAKGKYFIDLSGDDMFFPKHIECSVKKLEQHPEAWAVFSNVELLQVETGTSSFFYTSEDEIVEEGDLYTAIVAGNPVLSVSLVVSSEKFRQEGMYDVSLTYEDFDLMVRLSRKYPLFYTGQLGVKKSIHAFSFSSQQYQARQSKMLPSTYQVCRKIQAMNRSEHEQEALKARVIYELKMAAFSANFQIAKDLIKLAMELGVSKLYLLRYQLICQMGLDLSFMIRWKQRLWKG
ncbi:MAG: glycosyltransferase family 2 protein [Mongoliitalea sp.]